ncbi:MAG: HAD-IIA family hydrolase [Halanaerobiaceae bacterium]
MIQNNQFTDELNNNSELGDKQGFIIDLDGVVWKGEQIIPGCFTVIEKLKELQKDVIFVSNNSSMSKKDVLEKLKKKGISTMLENIFNAPAVTARYIKEKHPEANVFVLGMEGLKDEIYNAGLDLSEPEQAQFLVAGYDKNLNYDSLAQGLKALLNGAKFIATNEDGILPTNKGFLPGAGATIGAVKGMIKEEPDVVIGKPNNIMIEMALKHFQLEPEECVFIGDTLETDILLANKIDMSSILVLSGNTDREKALKSQIQADYIFPSIADLIDYL